MTKKQLEEELAKARQEAVDLRRKYDEACAAMIKLAQAQQPLYVPYFHSLPIYPWTYTVTSSDTIPCGLSASTITKVQ